MNCPSRVDPEFPEGYNQNPSALNADATTRADLGFVANERARDGRSIDCLDMENDNAPNQLQATEDGDVNASKTNQGLRMSSEATRSTGLYFSEDAPRPSGTMGVTGGDVSHARQQGVFGGTVEVIRKYLTFIGPGFMVAVAYIDPGKLLCSVSRDSRARQN